ncbi:MAG: acetyl-CoA carboxylase biotin carboxyl carrier protein subunit [Candidatus Chloroheliales bacterium]|nr:MAG: acetyl-CoA carboxylase biotin carboxyl carrier protein subunit [Chloroflexota bacterium]
MRYYAKVEGSDEEIELNVDEDGNVSRDGHEADLLALGTGHYSLLLDGRSYDLYATPVTDEPGHTSYNVSVGQRHLHVEVQSERERRIRKAAPAAHASGEISIKAPMPGLVTGLAVAVGETVQANQRLLLLEAMKMENEIRAPRPGTVKSVSVAKGDKVEQGRVLVVIE